MATSRSTESSPHWASAPGIRLPKLLRPIDRIRESRLLPLRPVHRLLRTDYLGFCYHNVSAVPDPLTHYGYDTKQPAEFEHDLGLLAATFGLADAAPFASHAAPVPRHRGAALLSFDDGHREWLDVVLPILQRRGANALMFVVSGTLGNDRILPAHAGSLCIHELVATHQDLHDERAGIARGHFGLPAEASVPVLCDTIRAHAVHERLESLLHLFERWRFDLPGYLARYRPYLDEAQLRQLAAAGCTIGSHSLDHRSLHHAGMDEVARQVLESSAIIRDITGQRVVPFAFPYSRRVPAAPLAELRRREPWLGAYFGTGGALKAPPGFYERIVADWRFSTGSLQRADAVLTLAGRAYLTRIGSSLRGVASRDDTSP